MGLLDAARAVPVNGGRDADGDYAEGL